MNVLTIIRWPVLLPWFSRTRSISKLAWISVKFIGRWISNVIQTYYIFTKFLRIFFFSNAVSYYRYQYLKRMNNSGCISRWLRHGDDECNVRVKISFGKIHDGQALSRHHYMGPITKSHFWKKKNWMRDHDTIDSILKMYCHHTPFSK